MLLKDYKSKISLTEGDKRKIKSIIKVFKNHKISGFCGVISVFRFKNGLYFPFEIRGNQRGIESDI